MALPRSLGRVLADTGEVMDKKEKKEVNIEIMKIKFSAVKTIKHRKIAKAAQSTSHRLSSCQVVLTKRLLLVLSEIEFCQNLSVEFGPKLSF